VSEEGILVSKALKAACPSTCVQRPKLLRPNGAIYQAINADTLRAQNLETWPYFNQVSWEARDEYVNLIPCIELLKLWTGIWFSFLFCNYRVCIIVYVFF
jgi:hypothetical protein